ncbi:formate dehydrogenase accessory sulfurtransferase FdhD [Acidicapsa dinghuensis]|uniref:Sulfur carrier protein FdhD n=1 Tax=Acidicapsa dinghuensis TaxID=2218256 RepID=A0ABW1EAQ1_9BACT|nr:formate dehydrogenase accessory sulfurtransferase FdhD [Acidicapsa dinghuensis]
MGKSIEDKAEGAVPERSLQLTQVMEWNDGAVHRQQDELSAEEPLDIRVGDGGGDFTPISVTMRTPGNDEELAAGFLWTEGIVEDAAQIAGVALRVSSASGKRNVVEIELGDSSFEPRQLQRNFFAASSCGICGKASIEAIRRRGLRAPNQDFRISPGLLCELPDRLREKQAVFRRTGGLHAAALFNAAGELLVLREDIGRHNAVDKIAGWALMRGLLPLSQHMMLVSGRGGFEIVQKCLAVGLPVLASVSAPSNLAVQLARELGLTLVGFLRERRFVIYAGEQRLGL